MYQYRVTKYDPAARDFAGRYTRDEWTSVSDIGREFDAVIFTQDDYFRVESSYVTAALEFLDAARVSMLTVVGLENHNGSAQVADGDVLNFARLANVMPQVLRADFWCRFESEAAFIHFGYDYYMYIGVPKPCPEAIVSATRRGLFVEEFESPYNDDQK